MIYIQYFFMALITIPLTLLALVLAPVLPLFASSDGWLPRWLWWFQTPDNSLDGDQGWITEHWQFRYSLPHNLCVYVGRVGWLIRNPAYAFGVRYLSFPDTATFTGDNTIGDNQTAKEGWVFVKAAGLFQYVYIKRIGQTQKCLYVNLGWNLRGLIGRDLHPSEHYEATFVFSPRISGYDSNTARG